MTVRRITWPLALALAASCGLEGAEPAPPPDEPGADEPNPFLEEPGPSGKEDSAYYNPDGIEVEVDLEGDAEGSEARLADAPALIGQFALTYLRKTGNVYLESLAEQATSEDRVEWLVDGAWIPNRDAVGRARRHFRIRGINAVLLHEARSGVEVGTIFTAPVPVNPFTVMADAGDTCAEEGDGHIGLDPSVYWYMWEPDRAGCRMEKQELQIRVSKLLPSQVSYLEYDQLLADGKITAVVLFGQIDDDPLTESDTGFRELRKMSTWLKNASWKKAASAPVGERWSKTVNGVVLELDLYSPSDFAGLGDDRNFPNFQRALSEHEIITYDGHSMLGASDFWSRPTYPGFYQVFLYGGCLGYEYYVAPIVGGKGGWGKLDIVSSVVEVTASANYIAAPFLSKLQWSLTRGNKASWKDLIGAIRSRVGDSTFGASGVRDNCYTPTGSRCAAAPPAGARRYEDGEPAAIPDDDATGVSRTLVVPDTLTVDKVTLELDVAHTYVSDLTITLKKGTTTVTVWENEGGDGDAIDAKIELDDFAGKAGKGNWVLKVVDGAAIDEGTLNRWAITITPR